MLVAEPLLEPQHALADHREAEVPGLDDAGVHRPDRDLVHAVAFDRDEGVARIAWDKGGVGGNVAPQRMRIVTPCAMPKPAASVGPRAFDVVRLEPRQVEHRALHPPGAGKERGKVGIDRPGIGHRQFKPEQPLVRRERGMHRKAAARVAFVTRPERGKAAAALGDGGTGAEPAPRVAGCVPGRNRAGQRFEREAVDRGRGRGHPISRAAMRYQLARYGGM